MLWFIVYAVLCTGCVSIDWACPYIVEDVHVAFSGDEDLYDSALYFDLYNTSQKEIAQCTVSFLLYDEDGNNALEGGGAVVADVEVSLPAMSSVCCVVSLDPFIAELDEDGYKADYFYIRNIVYRDGSVWSDPLGMYASGEL